MKKFFNFLILIIILSFFGFIGYNYYYYSKAQTLNKDIFRNIKINLDNLNTSLSELSNKNIKNFLDKNYWATNYSNSIMTTNRRIYNNIFVKVSLLQGPTFSSDLSDTLLWFSNLNAKLNTFEVLSKEILSSSVLFTDNQKTKKDLNEIKVTLLDINNLINTKNKTINTIVDVEHLENEYILDLQKNIQNAYNFFNILDYTLNNGKPSKTLILFQNPNDLNQSGGKWIYYSILECNNYKCSIVSFDVVSNLTTAMNDKLIPPDEIRSKKSIWIYEDLGWFFDFNDSASLALKYYPQKTEFNSVIAMNINIFEEILKISKKIDFDDSTGKGYSINQFNVKDFLINATQYKNNKELSLNSELINSFWNGLIKNISNAKKNNEVNYSSLINIIFNNLKTKQVQIYNPKSITNDLKNLKFNNSLLTSTNDYFALTRSNIGNTFSDQNVFQKVSLKTEINQKGTVQTTASIEVSNKNSLKIKDKVYSYFQFYLPKNTKIIKTSFPSIVGTNLQSNINYEKHGFINDPKIETLDNKTVYLSTDDVKIVEDNNRLTVGGWVITNSNSQKTIELVYELEKPIDLSKKIYTLDIQKQPNLDYPLSLTIKYPNDVSKDFNSISKTFNINDDKEILINLY